MTVFKYKVVLRSISKDMHAMGKLIKVGIVVVRSLLWPTLLQRFAFTLVTLVVISVTHNHHSNGLVCPQRLYL